MSQSSVELSDALVLGLLSSRELAAAFPWVKAYQNRANAATSTQCCGRLQSELSVICDQARSAIGSTPPQDLERLKALAGLSGRPLSYRGNPVGQV